MSRTDAQTTEAMLNDLRLKNDTEIKAVELVLPIGMKTRRCDFWTISPHASKAYQAVAYELKASRSDFLRDTAEKQAQALKWSDLFYYVAPAGLITAEEVPSWAGLIWWNSPEVEPRRYRAFSYKKRAPKRSKKAPDWPFVTTLLRHSRDIQRDGAIEKAWAERRKGAVS